MTKRSFTAVPRVMSARLRRRAGGDAVLAARKYMAARPDRLAGRFGGLLASSTRQQARDALRGLIAHARHGAQNIDWIKSYEMMVARHVVGPKGITLQMDARDPRGTADTRANDLIEKAWAKWSKRGNATICGRLSWWNVERIAAIMLAREGNFLLRTHTGRRRGPFAFQVEVLSIDLLDIDLMAQLRGGNYIDGGVEFNQDGRVVAFHMWRSHPAEHHHGRPTDRVRVPAGEVIHVFRPTEAMQALGVPGSHTALRRFNMLAQYEEAALTAAHYGAAAMVFFEQEGDGGEAPVGTSDAGPPPEEIEAGSAITLAPGVKVSSHAPNYPDAAMPHFNKGLLRGGASGLGVSYAGLTGDMEGANFSSLRDGRGEERDEWRMFQRDLWEGLHAEVFKRWLPVAILAGAIPLPFAKLDKFDAATWRARGWASVNPKDDAVANAADLNNGLRAPSDIVAERGEDYEQVVQRTRRDLDLLKAAGLPLPGAMIAQTTATGPAGILAEPDAEDDPESSPNGTEKKAE